MPLVELFLSVFIQVLFQQLASGAIKALVRREKVESHFEKLKQSLLAIQAVLDDAEEKQLMEKSVKLWLENLRVLAYDLDDLLDEITTQALIQESKGIQHSRTSMMWKFIPTCGSSTPRALVSNHKTMSRIKEITKRLEFIVNQSIELNLREISGGLSNQSSVIRSPSTSLVMESQVYGRDEDKEAIIRMLLGDEACNEDGSVISIVGMGGIGKTTLAQLVYNDRNIKDNFHVRVWVSVSEEFDVVSITKTICESVTGVTGQSRDLDMLQVKLKDKLAKSKFLIVLDDVWNENYGMWDDLCRPFQLGLPGSRIIVTTRNESVASLVGSLRTAYHIKLLTDDDCLSLLVQYAGRSFDETNLSLAKKCKGLPLAARMLGGLLRPKETKEEWEAVLSSKIWDLQEENNILPILRLSYHHLPSHLKHLFAYCSIFPKDYEFDKIELVHLWMGEGFLEQPNRRKRKEDLGLEYFNELVSRSLFQRLSGIDSHFVMHPLINDLAQFVAGDLCSKLDMKVQIDDEYRICENTRHASFLRHRYEVFTKFKGFYRVKSLRTFLPMPVQAVDVLSHSYLSNRILFDLLPKLHSSRVLSLSGYCITEVPDSICKLIHLRYLNLSGTSISSLPESVKDLYNLETLSVRNCRFICKLPPSVGKLGNLRHLDNSNTERLIELPVELGKLKGLQSLTKIVLSKVGGLRLRELGNLVLLRGTVALVDLQNVIDVEDAKGASMRHKDIEELHLSWVENNNIDDSRDGRLEQDVLDVLQPNNILRKLEIKSYGGVQFPSWIGDPSFSSIFSVTFSGCTGCRSLPPLGLLPNLSHLHIGDMPIVECIGVEFFGKHVVDVPFPKLETLKFDHMPMWQEWSCFPDELYMQFPFLHKLTISKCPKLATVSPLSLPVLRDLDLEECNMTVLKTLRDLGSLNYLKVGSITGLCHLPRELVQSMARVEVLKCNNCNELVSMWPSGVAIQHLSSLRCLVVADCPLFKSVGEKLQQLPCNLEILELSHCASLSALPMDLRNFRSLRELVIENCPIINFPERVIPSLLKGLNIVNCNALEYLPNDMSNLESLEICGCPRLGNWPAANFPYSLKKLSIKKCSKLEPVPIEVLLANRRIPLEELSIWNSQNFSNLLQHVHNFTCITKLYLYQCDGPECFPNNSLPPYLRTLSIEHCSNLKSLPTQIQNMWSIISIEIRGCCKLESFPGCDFPPNLSSLKLWDSGEFKPLSQWGLDRLTSLREFYIRGGFEELQLLAENNVHHLFPSSLIEFFISEFPKLNSLFGMLDNLASLKHLSIMDCTSLNVLPSENVLEKLWRLRISGCPLLERQCLKDRGDYWPKIAGIPCVQID